MVSKQHEMLLAPQHAVTASHFGRALPGTGLQQLSTDESYTPASAPHVAVLNSRLQRWLQSVLKANCSFDGALVVLL